MTSQGPLIGPNSSVSFHYTGTLGDGTVFDSSEGKEPLSVELGKNGLIPGFEKALIGMAIGEKKTFTVPKEEAYAHHAELVTPIPRSAVPAEMEIKEGMRILLRAPTGDRIPALVIKVDDESMTVDMNMPVAGKDLTFAVEIVSVN